VTTQSALHLFLSRSEQNTAARKTDEWKELRGKSGGAISTRHEIYIFMRNGDHAAAPVRSCDRNWRSFENE